MRRIYKTCNSVVVTSLLSSLMILLKEMSAKSSDLATTILSTMRGKALYESVKKFRFPVHREIQESTMPQTDGQILSSESVTPNCNQTCGKLQSMAMGNIERSVLVGDRYTSQMKLKTPGKLAPVPAGTSAPPSGCVPGRKPLLPLIRSCKSCADAISLKILFMNLLYSFFDMMT